MTSRTRREQTEIRPDPVKCFVLAIRGDKVVLFTGSAAPAKFDLIEVTAEVTGPDRRTEGDIRLSSPEVFVINAPVVDEPAGLALVQAEAGGVRPPLVVRLTDNFRLQGEKELGPVV